ncbi:proline-rich extensin-like protein EPR1 [Chrysoperla carnea]|uniref:proline-rich extensin-like protein EPR1 n=1 Tax=Chrysoperla carnea TaxID=189513 RepID=UPI001D094994|nr:proline-rich extensin-like protein EPR1 [Chrysoperla carnea]
MLRYVLVLATVIIAVSCRPEPPSSYAAPQGPSGGSYPAPAPRPQYGPPQQAPTVHKHVYVHVPPPDNEYPAPRRPLEYPPAQKHYKIIFIKAPTPPTPTAPVIPAQPQDEQKTLVYVLVKKPEEAPEIQLPQPVPTQPSKPEVYFIRYKTQKEEGGYPNSVAPAPSGDYGAPAGPAPAGPPSSSYGAPSF